MNNYYVLRNGVKVPSIGLGTWKVLNEEAYGTVKNAINAGYRHIDTAAMYDNEQIIGKAIKDSNIPREDIFITSKLPNGVGNFDGAINAFNETIKRLDVDYLDLYLIHWPAPLSFRDHYKERNISVWKAAEDLYKQNKIRGIGVSNFMVHHLDNLIPYVDIVPMVNQIEIHPYGYDSETIKYCSEKNILIEAFSPLARGQILGDDTINKIALKYNKSIAQICIRWCLQKKILPLPKSTNVQRINENIDVFDFELSKEDMNQIDKMKREDGRIISHPDTAKY